MKLLERYFTTLQIIAISLLYIKFYLIEITLYCIVIIIIITILITHMICYKLERHLIYIFDFKVHLMRLQIGLVCKSIVIIITNYDHNNKRLVAEIITCSISPLINCIKYDIRENK